MIPAFEKAKTVRALDRAATVMLGLATVKDILVPVAMRHDLPSIQLLAFRLS
jgi:hypothetical protein